MFHLQWQQINSCNTLIIFQEAVLLVDQKEQSQKQCLNQKQVQRQLDRKVGDKFMALSVNETQFLVWAALTMMGILGFIGALGVKALMNMGKDLNEIKVAVKEVATKHDETEKRVTLLEKHVFD